MNLNTDPAETARLEALAYQAQDYALYMMRTTGSVPPTAIADTADGFIRFGSDTPKLASAL